MLRRNQSVYFATRVLLIGMCAVSGGGIAVALVHLALYLADLSLPVNWSFIDGLVWAGAGLPVGRWCADILMPPRPNTDTWDADNALTKALREHGHLGGARTIAQRAERIVALLRERHDKLQVFDRANRSLRASIDSMDAQLKQERQARADAAHSLAEVREELEASKRLVGELRLAAQHKCPWLEGLYATLDVAKEARPGMVEAVENAARKYAERVAPY